MTWVNLQLRVALMCPNAHQHVGAPHVLASARIVRVTMYASSWRESPSYRPLPASASPDRPAPHLLPPLFQCFSVPSSNVRRPTFHPPLFQYVPRYGTPCPLFPMFRETHGSAVPGGKATPQYCLYIFHIQRTQIYHIVYI